jgi:hypothetical protein
MEQLNGLDIGGASYEPVAVSVIREPLDRIGIIFSDAVSCGIAERPFRVSEFLSYI